MSKRPKPASLSPDPFFMDDPSPAPLSIIPRKKRPTPLHEQPLDVEDLNLLITCICTQINVDECTIDTLRPPAPSNPGLQTHLQQRRMPLEMLKNRFSSLLALAPPA